MCVWAVDKVIAVMATSSIALAIDGPAPGAASAAEVKLPDRLNYVRSFWDGTEVNVASAQLEYVVPNDVPNVTTIGTRKSRRESADLGNGALGIGWSLSHAAIRRSTCNGVPHFDDSDEIVILSVANGRLIRACQTERTEQRELLAPVHPHAVPEFLAALDRRVASAHGDVHPLERNADHAQERFALRDDVGSQTLQPQSALSFTT